MWRLINQSEDVSIQSNLTIREAEASSAFFSRLILFCIPRYLPCYLISGAAFAQDWEE